MLYYFNYIIIKIIVNNNSSLVNKNSSKNLAREFE